MLREAKERAKTLVFSLMKELCVVCNVGVLVLCLLFKKLRNDYFECLKLIVGLVMMVVFIKCIFVGVIVRFVTVIFSEAFAANGVFLIVYFFFVVVGEGVS